MELCWVNIGVVAFGLIGLDMFGLTSGIGLVGAVGFGLGRDFIRPIALSVNGDGL